MKRAFAFVLAIAALGIGAYFLFFNKEKVDSGPNDQPLAIGENTGTFNQSFDNLLTAYFSVKDALVASDTSQANKAADALIVAADSLKTDEIQGDSTGGIKATAKDFAGTISGWGKGLKGENGIEAKRKEFEMISDALWSLTRTVKYAGLKVYYQYCPMAFDNKGAYWMSKERQIKNPYFGDKMPECGSIEDSLDYSHK